MINLRSYQLDILNQTIKLIDEDKNPIIQLDTGAGKTPIMSAICDSCDNFIVIAHRNFLVKQASETLSKMGVSHDVMSSRHTRNACIVSAIKYNKNLIYSNNKIVCSVDTLLSKKKRQALNFNSSLKWVVIIDEAHHALDDNKWGLLKKVLPGSIFVGFTATPIRSDGRSLNKDSGGLFDTLVQANELKINSVETLIKNKYLCEFKCYIALPTDVLNCDTNEYIIGEYVKSYRRYAKNKRAIVMCSSIKEAEFVAKQYRDNGFSAMCISSKMTQTSISRIIDDFKRGIINIICNVAMIDEGFDVPSVECLIMLRDTNFRTYRQWVGRVLRPKDTHAMIIDHATNIITHGLPDSNVNWNLYTDTTYNKKLIDCIKCGYVFHISKLKCPECGHVLSIEEEKKRSQENSRVRSSITATIHEYKRKNEQELKAIEMANMYKTSIQKPPIMVGNGIMNAIIKGLADRFIEKILPFVENNEISYENFNDFMSVKFNDQAFWISNFKASEQKNFSGNKAFSVYKKCGGKL